MLKYLLLYCSLISAIVKAQQPENFNSIQYTTENGLPSNGIKGIEFDEETDFLWMATEAGIVRFNGVDFRSFTKENTPAIASERLLFMVKNDRGKIYVSDQHGNLFFINKNEPVLSYKSAVNRANNPYLINYFFVGVSDLLFKKYSTSSRGWPMAQTFNKLVNIDDTSFFTLNEGSLYYNSLNQTKPVALSFIKQTINTAFKIGANYFITNIKNEVFRINYAEQTLSEVRINFSSDGKLRVRGDTSQIHWHTGMPKPIYIDGANAYEFSYKDNVISADFIFSGIPIGSFVRAVRHSPKNKLLFIATESKGIIIITQNRVQTKRRKTLNSKNRNQYYSQIELSDGNILTNESDIIGNSPVSSAALPIKGKFEFNVAYTDDNLLWYNQTQEGPGSTLHQYNKSTGQTKVFEKIRWGDFVAKSGASIYLANKSAIGVLQADSFSLIYKFNEKLSGVDMFDFKEIEPGILALATCAGVLRFNTATKKLDTLFTKENICVRSIWKYKDYIFFGSYGSGYFIYRNGRIKSMPLDKNKFLLYTHCFVADKNGFCWISTNRGLFKANLEELISVFENSRSAVYYHYFGKKEGMEMTELNGGCTPCAITLRDQTISFPTMDGLLWVNPESALPVLPFGEIYIDDVIIDNEIKDISYLTGSKLPADTRDITLGLAFSAWCNTENIYLEYQLNNSDDWKPVDFESRTKIKFTNLTHGNYKLKIRKVNGYGPNNYSYKSINFSIITPWHKRWWFYLMSIVGIVTVFTVYFRVKTRQHRLRQLNLEAQVAEKTKELQSKNEILEKNNSIKTRLISIISHDIITPLKFLTVAGQNLVAKRSVMSDELQQETITEITNTSQELHLLSTNILNWIKYQNENRRIAKENFNLTEMINQVFGILNSLAKQKKLSLINAVHNDMQVYQHREPLKILIYNLLTNAINFSERGKIEVSAREHNGIVTIEVKDEGVGMNQEQIQNIIADQFIISSTNIDNRKGNGLGYLIIKDLVIMMDAHLEISSSKGVGTTVALQFPQIS